MLDQAIEPGRANVSGTRDYAGIIDDRPKTTAVGGVHPTVGCHTIAGDEETNLALAKFQEGLKDWNFAGKNLAEMLQNIRTWSEELWNRFVPSPFRGEPIAQPEIHYRFCNERPTVLGHYHPGRNDTGLRWEISINPRHFRDRSEAQVAAVVLHEIFHCFEELSGTLPKSRNNYHTAWFRRHAKSVGIPCSVYGRELGITTPSPFAIWAHERCLSFDGVMVPPTAQEEVLPSRNKRVVWCCACPSSHMVKVMVARGSDLLARCERCGAAFRRR